MVPPVKLTYFCNKGKLVRRLLNIHPTITNRFIITISYTNQRIRASKVTFKYIAIVTKTFCLELFHIQNCIILIN